MHVGEVVLGALHARLRHWLGSHLLLDWSCASEMRDHARERAAGDDLEASHQGCFRCVRRRYENALIALLAHPASRDEHSVDVTDGSV
jgi:hypothetical protein